MAGRSVVTEPAATRVALRVHDPGQCPCLSRNDLIVFDGRGIDLRVSSAVCVEMLCDIYPLVVRNLVSQEPGTKLLKLTIPCAFRGCGASFEVEPGPPRLGSAPPYAQALSRGSFMSRLPREECEVIRAVAEEVEFAPGEVMIQQGLIGDRLLIIGVGEAEVYLSQDGSEETILATLGSGDCVGEISLLTGRPATAAVRARSTCHALLVTREAFDRLLDHSPLLNRVLTQIVYDRFRRANLDIDDERRASYRGKLRSVGGMTGLLQALGQSRRTGVVVILNGKRLGRLGFVDGVPTGFVLFDLSDFPANARFQNEMLDGREPLDEGMEAFFSILAWEEGEFRFHEDDQESRGALGAGLMTLLMEGARRLDEAR